MLSLSSREQRTHIAVSTHKLMCTAMPNVQPDQHCKGSSNAPTWHAIAAFNWADAVPSLVAAGIPVAAADCALVTVDQPFDLTLQPSWKLERLESPLHTCALSLAATLGHVDTLAAMLVAGADPNPVEPHGRWMWHPLAAAAMSSRRTWSQALQEVVTVPEASALEMCRQLLAAGADILVACGAGYMPEHVGQPGPNWPLWLHSQPIQRLLLSELVQRCNSAPEPFQPSFRLCHDFLLLAAQLDDTAAYNAVASRVPAGRAPAEYAALATQLVDGARSGRGQRLMLRHMAQQAAAVAAAAAEPAGLAAHIGAALEHTLQGAAKHGELWEVSMLMDAGVRVSMAAINAAVAACRPEALALLLPQLRPAARLAVEHKAGGSKAWTVPSRGPQSYACPLLTLLGCRADEVSRAKLLSPGLPPACHLACALCLLMHA